MEQQDSFRMGICLNCIADHYLKLDSIEKAAEFYEKSLNVNSKTNNLNILGNYYKGIGELYEKQFKYDSAHKYFIKAINTYQEFNATRRLGYAYSLFANHCIHINQLDSSLIYAQKGLNIGNKCNDKELIRNSLNVLRETYSKMNNYKKAYLYFGLYKSMEDSLQKNISLQSLAIMEVEHEFKLQKEKTDLEHKTLLSKQKTAKRIFMGSFVFVTIIVLLISYALYQRIKRNSMLRKANDTRDKMMRLIAHDFRSPLISISSTLQTIPMLIEEQDCNSIKQMCENVEGSVTRVLTLIDNLINWTLSQHDSIPYNPDNYNLKDICSDITEIYKPVAEFKQIKLVNLITTDQNIYADKNILRTILRNLINNAIKFTPEKGEISITAEHQNGNIELCIQDNGIGMD
ncbi:MAG: tetratricopeptide repeat-containing sensor histidine kinase [Bacteroidales bacterium]|nr:tetratricopeptide repeat-containing sensor histidine kinase [Bacteroidales bacterium]